MAPEASSDDLRNQLTVYVGEPHVPAIQKICQPGAIDAQQVQIKALVARLKAGDTTALSQMQALSSDDINSQFDALGMTTCGSGSGG